MNNQVICAIQTKGGAGKSTLIAAMATYMNKDQAKIAIIDTDPQKSTYEFCKSFDNFNFDYQYISDANIIGAVINKLKEIGYDAIFIDTEGFDSSMVTFVIAQSDLVLIPSKADKNNAIGAVKTYGRVQATAQNMNKVIPAYVVMMDIDKKTNITRKMVDKIKSSKIPMLKTMIGHGTGFKELSTMGKVPKSGATKKYIEALFCELQMKELINFYDRKLEVA